MKDFLAIFKRVSSRSATEIVTLYRLFQMNVIISIFHSYIIFGEIPYIRKFLRYKIFEDGSHSQINFRGWPSSYH